VLALIFISCDSNNTTGNDSDLGDENCIITTDLWENGGGGGEGCELQYHDDSFKRDITVGCSKESPSYEVGENFVVENLEFSKYQEKDSVGVKGKCIHGCEEDGWCGFGLIGYDTSLLKDSIVGKEMTIYYRESYYGELVVVKAKDGALVAVKGVNIFNGNNEQGNTGELWPSSLVPEIKIKQEILSTCEPFCMKYRSGESHEPEGDWQYDSLIAPPLKITVEGKDPVIVSNGEVVKSQGYEYFVRNSIRTTEDDKDGYYFKLGVPLRFDFFIVNTEALK